MNASSDRRAATPPADIPENTAADGHAPAPSRLIIEEPNPAARAGHIRRLAASWSEARDAAKEAAERLFDAQDEAGELYPPCPADFERALRDWLSGLRAAEAQLRRWTDSGTPRPPSARRWDNQKHAIDVAFGVPPLQEEADLTYDIAEALMAKILAAPAADAADIAIKLAVIIYLADQTAIDPAETVPALKRLHAEFAGLLRRRS